VRGGDGRGSETCGEQQEELLSAATIIAAQLATLVGPPATRSRAEATG